MTVNVAEGLGDRARRAVEGLTPGYFALVMATGIISVGMHLEGFHTLSRVLLGVCGTAFVVLLALTGWRLVAYRSAVVEDFTDPRRGFGFFTFVAGTNVLGVRLGLAGFHEATAVLLAVAGAAWLGLGYVVPWTAVLGRQERPVLATANGTWFIWVVASQSVAVAAATIEPVYDAVRRELAVLAIVSWSVGVFLYAAAGLLVALRLMLYEFGPEELTPPYWVSMGALAITVLAGARIVEMADAPMVAVTRDLIAGLAVVFWAFATWLIPVLVAAGWWRHVRRRVPLRYEATLWSIIFPLGMYAVAGIYLGRADDLPVVEAVGRTELWVAFAACLLVLAAMVVHVVRTVVIPVGPGGGPTYEAPGRGLRTHPLWNPFETPSAEEIAAARVRLDAWTPAAVEVVGYDPAWPQWYAAARDRVCAALGERVLEIEHVGSTSVPGLCAKPVIDIDLTVADSADETAWLPDLEAAGFVLRVREPEWEEHRCLRGQEPATNLHVFSPGAREPQRHRMFRDWLRNHPEDRDRYAAVKQEVAARGFTDAMLYNNEKAWFVYDLYEKVFAGDPGHGHDPHPRPRR